MKITSRFIALAAAAALLASAAPALAQHAGFRIGIQQQPAFGFPPTQAPAVFVRGGTFTGTAGFVQFPASPFVVPAQGFAVPGQQFIVPGQQFLIPGQQFIVPRQQFVSPNPVFVPNQPIFVPNQPMFVPSQVIAPNPQFLPNQVLVPGQTVVTPQAFPTIQPQIGHFGPPVRLAPPPIGMARGQVIQQFGEPTISIITSRGEVLRFRGDVTVVIQNGQVVSPR